MADVRCAIYTRKSTEEGLEQDFNSLDAQREACAAFIASQKHEGWQALKDSYDDGGFSGGNIDRPALQRLFADIQQGNVNTIVVYKIDRLTRSLADFAKMVELFDSHGVTFVSVTQQFNTTTSMGRLTLNVLLSFAQFEREVTGERIRDKIAASKAKGMWMGGTVPLGYTVKDRQLQIHPTEAERVRHIFATYLNCGSVIQLRNRLYAEGHRTRSGRRFHTGNLANLLCNPVYLGKIPHKGKLHDGYHAAIISPEVFDQVQVLRTQSKAIHRHRLRSKEPSLLAGKLFDAHGHPMSPGHANKNGKRYRYYISQGLIQGKQLGEGTPTRIPAAEIEAVVERHSLIWLSKDSEVSQILGENSLFLRRESQRLAEAWPTLQTTHKHQLLRTLLAKVTLKKDTIEVKVSRPGLRAILSRSEHTTTPADETISLLIPIKLKPVEGGATLILTDGPLQKPREPNPELVRAMAHGHVANRLLVTGECKTQRQVAQKLQIAERQVRRVLPLALLAPDIVTAVLQGTQPPSLSIRLLGEIATYSDWPTQRQKLAFL